MAINKNGDEALRTTSDLKKDIWEHLGETVPRMELQHAKTIIDMVDHAMRKTYALGVDEGERRRSEIKTGSN